MDPRLSAPPPAPFCDCYATQHSAEATWASSAPADTVYKALRRAVSSPAHEGVLLRAPTPFEECAYYGSSVTAFLSSAAASSGEKERQDGDPRADVSVVRVSPSAGFRDFVAFYVLPAALVAILPAEILQRAAVRTAVRKWSREDARWTTTCGRRARAAGAPRGANTLRVFSAAAGCARQRIGDKICRRWRIL